MRENSTAEIPSATSSSTDKNLLSTSICDYLKEHLRDRVTLDMLSERFHFGKVYLCDVFKKNIGTSIMNYHLDLKISEAKRLLRETKMSVSEISEHLGFESQSYFSRCFKSRVGHPPQSFRKMLINNYAVRRGK
jgi:AraC-like DNA-binding protein